MVFAQINMKKDRKSKFNAEMTIVFASPSLKKGVNFGTIVSIYENKSETEVKKAIFSVEIRFFLKFCKFFSYSFKSTELTQVMDGVAKLGQFEIASNCISFSAFFVFSICTNTLFGKHTTEFAHPRAIQVLFGQGESIMRTLQSEISKEVLPVAPCTVKIPSFCKEYSNFFPFA